MPELRVVAEADLDLICRHRREMFHEAGRAEVELAAMAAPFRLWLAERLRDGSYFGFVAEIAGQPAGGVGLMLLDWPPHPSHPLSAHRGYVLNLFVEQEHRGRGVARALMAAAEQAFVERGADYAILHATDAGRPLYERMGWSATTEMARSLTT